nr:MAG TPA: Protein of unknown function (DUF2626) [Caudoviricetes sp.]
MIEEAVKLNLPFHKAHSVVMGNIKYWYFPDSVRRQLKENMLCYIARREDNKVIGEATIATIIEGTPQEVFSQTALYTELSAPMYLSIFGNYQTVSAIGFADVRPYREEIYIEDSEILDGICETFAQAAYEVDDLQDRIPTLSGEDIDELLRIISRTIDEVYRLAVLLPTDRPRKKDTRK